MNYVLPWIQHSNLVRYCKTIQPENRYGRVQYAVIIVPEKKKIYCKDYVFARCRWLPHEIPDSAPFKWITYNMFDNLDGAINEFDLFYQYYHHIKSEKLLVME